MAFPICFYCTHNSVVWRIQQLFVYYLHHQFYQSVKVMNKAKKKEYVVEKSSATTPFGSLESIKTALKEVDHIVGNIGYIEPGHRLKGKQKWLLDDSDVSEMYVVHKNKREVMLYVFVDRQVKGGNPSAPTHLQNEEPKALPTTKYAKTITEVETIMSELKQKHGQQYDTGRYACWAHTIHSGKHSSYDEPPDLPYFTRCKKKSNSQSREDGSSTSSGTPTKRLCLRTTCIDQLSKCHDLLQSGAISQVQYDEMKDVILKDMKSLT